VQISIGLSPANASTPKVAFSPASISGLQLWLDASDASTLFQNSNGTTAASTDGDPVGYWGDKSPNINNTIQADGTKKPLLKLATQNGKNSVRFDGINDNLKALTGGANSNYTLFVVNKKLNATAANYMLFSMGEEVNGRRRSLWHYPYFSDGYIAFNGQNADYSNTNVNLKFVQNVANIAQLQRNGQSISLAKNGNSYVTGTASATLVTYTATSIFVGTNNGQTEAYNGDYYEILYYNVLVSDSDRALILSYLNTKWGVY
jgi:hypothetical protein